MGVVLISMRTAHPAMYTLYFINDMRNTYSGERALVATGGLGQSVPMPVDSVLDGCV
jgi:hypothetical protein